jgi:hypothetical protein
MGRIRTEGVGQLMESNALRRGCAQKGLFDAKRLSGASPSPGADPASDVDHGVEGSSPSGYTNEPGRFLNFFPPRGSACVCGAIAAEGVWAPFRKPACQLNRGAAVPMGAPRWLLKVSPGFSRNPQHCSVNETLYLRSRSLPETEPSYLLAVFNTHKRSAECVL